MHNVSRVAPLLAALALAACGGTEPPSNNPPDSTPDGGEQQPPPKKPKGSAQFADWTADERKAALSMASGEGAALAFTHLFLADVDAEFGTCPVRTISEAGLIEYSAGEGCVTNAQVAYAGSITGENLHRLDETGYDSTKPTRATFNGFSRDDGQQALWMDGSIVQSAVVEGAYALELGLTLGTAPSVTIEESIECTTAADHTTCTVAEGARSQLSNRGTFVVRGTLETWPDGYSGWLELEGKDVLRVEFSRGVLCSPVTIDGKPAGEICRPENQEPPPPADVTVTGGGLLCEGDGANFTVLATVAGEAERVYVQLADATTSEQFDLVNTGPLEGADGEYIWQLTVIHGVDSGFQCADFERLGAKIVAEKGEGSACFLGNNGTESPWGDSDCL